MISLPIRDDHYFASLKILIGGQSELSRYFKRKYSFEYQHVSGFSGRHFSIEKKSTSEIRHFICLSKWNYASSQMGLLCHEMAHYCLSVMRDAQIPLSQDTEEPFAYYLGSMLQKAFWKLRNIKYLPEPEPSLESKNLPSGRTRKSERARDVRKKARGASTPSKRRKT